MSDVFRCSGKFPQYNQASIKFHIEIVGKRKKDRNLLLVSSVIDSLWACIEAPVFSISLTFSINFHWRCIPILQSWDYSTRLYKIIPNLKHPQNKFYILLMQYIEFCQSCEFLHDVSTAMPR